MLSEKDGKFYIGFTNNIERRLIEHNAGKSISTAKRRPSKLIYYDRQLSKADATRRENYFKTSKGKTTLCVMMKNTQY